MNDDMAACKEIFQRKLNSYHNRVDDNEYKDPRRAERDRVTVKKCFAFCNRYPALPDGAKRTDSQSAEMFADFINLVAEKFEV
jgi:hypothetical protein